MQKSPLPLDLPDQLGGVPVFRGVSRPPGDLPAAPARSRFPWAEFVQYLVHFLQVEDTQVSGPAGLPRTPDSVGDVSTVYRLVPPPAPYVTLINAGFSFAISHRPRAPPARSVHRLGGNTSKAWGFPPPIYSYLHVIFLASFD